MTERDALASGIGMVVVDRIGLPMIFQVRSDYAVYQNAGNGDLARV
jgi:hypothetical protein